MPCRRRCWLAVILFLIAFAPESRAQHYQADFPPEEFQARWKQVYEKIGDNAVAVVQGMPLTDGFILPRQFNTFYYLSGLETTGSYLLLDGRTKTATVYLTARNPRLEAAEGRVLSAEDADLVKRLTGADDVKAVDAMQRDNWPLGGSAAARPAPGARAAAPAIYVEFSPAEGVEQSRGELLMAETAKASDFWDGTTSRQHRFVELLRVRQPRAELRDLTPLLDEMRSIKSPREIAMLRRASQIAGLGLMEAIRSTEAGVTEYQLDAAARYVFLLNDARLEAYRSITATGTDTIANMHYFRNTNTLKDGDLVLMDYAPDYRYYVSDIGRVWPVSGKYSPDQRQLLQVVLEYHKAVMSRIKPGLMVPDIMADAKKAMEPIFAKTRFSKPIYEQAARTLVEKGGGVFSHTVGMSVHDVGRYAPGPLKVGQVFSLDPAIRVPEENLYLRYEDTGVVTETGFENFTAFLPSELDDLEKLVQEKGVVQKVPAGPSDAQLRSRR
jgi:Xaa-Pro aminopeptidase